ncbi:MAG: hypothetical protein WCK26_04005 [Candidatus Saccharibacteria bacterium]
MNTNTKKRTSILLLIIIIVIGVISILDRSSHQAFEEPSLNPIVSTQTLNIVIKNLPPESSGSSITGVTNAATLSTGWLETPFGCERTEGGTQAGTYECALNAISEDQQSYLVGNVIYFDEKLKKNIFILSKHELEDYSIKITKDDNTDVTMYVNILPSGAYSIKFDPDNVIYGRAEPLPDRGPGDCDGNGKVDDFDFIDVITHFGEQSYYGDCDGNGKVDDFDFIEVINNFGKVYR